jgi:hypothetical protein
MKNGYCMDADSIIRSWNIIYPINIFYSLWERLAELKEEMIIVDPIFKEIDPISSADTNGMTADEKRQKYPLRMWLIDNNFKTTIIGNETYLQSLQLGNKYQTNDSNNGAGFNDIKLISYAKILNKTVVTYEAVQNENPKKISKYKIPLICKEENVRCITFVKMLEELNICI